MTSLKKHHHHQLHLQAYPSQLFAVLQSMQDYSLEAVLQLLKKKDKNMGPSYHSDMIGHVRTWAMHPSARSNLNGPLGR